MATTTSLFTSTPSSVATTDPIKTYITTEVVTQNLKKIFEFDEVVKQYPNILSRTSTFSVVAKTELNNFFLSPDAKTLWCWGENKAWNQVTSLLNPEIDDTEIVQHCVFHTRLEEICVLIVTNTGIKFNIIDTRSGYTKLLSHNISLTVIPSLIHCIFTISKNHKISDSKMDYRISIWYTDFNESNFLKNMIISNDLTIEDNIISIAFPLERSITIRNNDFGSVPVFTEGIFEALILKRKNVKFSLLDLDYNSDLNNFTLDQDTIFHLDDFLVLFPMFSNGSIRLYSVHKIGNRNFSVTCIDDGRLFPTFIPDPVKQVIHSGLYEEELNLSLVLNLNDEKANVIVNINFGINNLPSTKAILRSQGSKFPTKDYLFSLIQNYYTSVFDNFSLNSSIFCAPRENGEINLIMDNPHLIHIYYSNGKRRITYDGSNFSTTTDPCQISSAVSFLSRNFFPESIGGRIEFTGTDYFALESKLFSAFQISEFPNIFKVNPLESITLSDMSITSTSLVSFDVSPLITQNIIWENVNPEKIIVNKSNTFTLLRKSGNSVNLNFRFFIFGPNPLNPTMDQFAYIISKFPALTLPKGDDSLITRDTEINYLGCIEYSQYTKNTETIYGDAKLSFDMVDDDTLEYSFVPTKITPNYMIIVYIFENENNYDIVKNVFVATKRTLIPYISITIITIVIFIVFLVLLFIQILH